MVNINGSINGLLQVQSLRSHLQELSDNVNVTYEPLQIRKDNGDTLTDDETMTLTMCEMVIDAISIIEFMIDDHENGDTIWLGSIAVLTIGVERIIEG